MRLSLFKKNDKALRYWTKPAKRKTIMKQLANKKLLQATASASNVAISNTKASAESSKTDRPWTGNWTRGRCLGGGFAKHKWSWITTPQIYTSMVWHPPKRDIIGTRKLKCRKENHPTRPLQIRCGADTNLLFKASIFCEFLGKIGGDAVMIISQANDGNVQQQPHIYQELPASEIAKSRCEQFIDLGNGTMRKKMILSSLGYETYSWGSEVLFGEIPLACWRQQYGKISLIFQTMRCNWKENLKHHCFLGPRLLYPTRPKPLRSASTSRPPCRSSRPPKGYRGRAKR